jgi:hypothetical protein
LYDYISFPILEEDSLSGELIPAFSSILKNSSWLIDFSFLFLSTLFSFSRFFTKMNAQENSSIKANVAVTGDSDSEINEVEYSSSSSPGELFITEEIEETQILSSIPKKQNRYSKMKVLFIILFLLLLLGGLFVIGWFIGNRNKNQNPEEKYQGLSKSTLVDFYIIGDWGKRTSGLLRVAKSMRTLADKKRPDFVCYFSYSLR